MNIIQKQADTFIERLMGSNLVRVGYPKEVIDKSRLELYEYHKDVHKVEFLERLIYRVKTAYDIMNRVLT